MNILDSIRDPRVFGSAHHYRNPKTWAPWFTVYSAIYGLPLEKDGSELFERCTGLDYDPPDGGWPEVVIRAGRQSGTRPRPRPLGIDP